eukprot:maker-scaffold_10-snap-gene-12.9-mRNA-1 protein AED:0.42 eAED:0.43 QI:0/0/0/0.5/0/0/2/0/67
MNSGRCPASYTLQYLHAFYWAVMATVGIGDDIRPVTNVEYLYFMFVIIVGVGLVAFIIGNLSSTFER